MQIICAALCRHQDQLMMPVGYCGVTKWSGHFDGHIKCLQAAAQQQQPELVASGRPASLQPSTLQQLRAKIATQW
jgi:hypothetical protein